MKLRKLTFLLFIAIKGTYAQPSVVWQHCTGGTEGDEGIFTLETHDHGFLVAAMGSSLDGDFTANHGEDDGMLIRLDSSNNIVWQKLYGGSLEDAIFSMVETADHGFVLAARSGSSDGDVTQNQGDDDVWIVKVDSAGTILWQHSYGGSDYDTPFSIIQTSSGNFMVLGITLSVDGDVTGNHGWDDFWLLKLDPSGNLIWQKTYGGSDTEWGYQVIQTSDGGFMLSGQSESTNGNVTVNHGGIDVWLVKTDSAGNIQWQKSYGGSEDDQTTNVLELSNGDFLFASTTQSFDGDVTGSIGSFDFWIVRTSPTGTILTSKCFGGTGFDMAFRMIPTLDHGFAITGLTSSNDVDVSGNHGYMDGWTIKLDSSLNMQWQVCSGGTDEELANGICQSTSGDYLLTGYAYSNDGDVSGNHGGGYEDIWTYRLSFNNAVPVFEKRERLYVYPNPAHTVLTLEGQEMKNKAAFLITVYDVEGRELIVQPGCVLPVMLDVQQLPPGSYRLGATDGENEFVQSFTKQ